MPGISSADTDSLASLSGSGKVGNPMILGHDRDVVTLVLHADCLDNLQPEDECSQDSVA